MAPLEIFGIGAGEFVALLIVGMLFFGPDKLPEIGRKAGRVFRYVRNIANDATNSIKAELGPEYQDLTVADLNPKTFLQKTLLAEVQEDLDEIKADLADVRSDLTGAGEDLAAATESAREALRSEPASAVETSLDKVSDALDGVEQKLELAAALDAPSVRFDAEAT